jgi:hypothetical protein
MTETRRHPDDEFAAVTLDGYTPTPGPLELAGVQCGDILMSCNGTPFFVLDEKDEVAKRKALFDLVNDPASYPVMCVRPCASASE